MSDSSKSITPDQPASDGTSGAEVEAHAADVIGLQALGASDPQPADGFISTWSAQLCATYPR
ncbi:hypothetical protein AB0M29_31925 [Streptomyces sp. NPDC051976]|uniref:hypothetical protein n=1 Tax=Streptomyces sp. NPDC051976 TaxID=3154947 RepID=UPI003423F343